MSNVHEGVKVKTMKELKLKEETLTSAQPFATALVPKTL